MMGRWSRLAGTEFLDWLALRPGLRWLDVGCGNGAFTELLIEKCAPAAIIGVDPSDGQLEYARARFDSPDVEFHKGEGQAVPFEDGQFNAVVMALAINMMADPVAGAAEMTRVARPGGCVATYMWDVDGGGFTMEPIRRVLDDMGVPTPMYHSENTKADRMDAIWRQAGLQDVSTRRIDVELTYDDFDDFWTGNTAAPNTIVRGIETLPPEGVETLKDRLRADLPTDGQGRIVYGAFANAVKGTKPAV